MTPNVLIKAEYVKQEYKGFPITNIRNGGRTLRASGREFTIVGDPVNLASRIMQAAEPGQLLIDRPTHQRVRDATVYDELTPIHVKGKSGPIDVWTVHAVRDRPSRRPTESAAPAPTSMSNRLRRSMSRWRSIDDLASQAVARTVVRA